MLKILSDLLQITRSKECRVAFSDEGSHFFGGKLENLEFRGIHPPCPLHNFLSIDTCDRNSPIRFEGGQYLPLLYPLSYTEGGEGISYRVVGDLEIEITHLPEADQKNHFPEFLPVRKAKLSPLTYAERRILHSTIQVPSPADQARLGRLWNRDLFKVSGMLVGYFDRFRCLRPSDEPTHCQAWKIAEFPATRIPFGEIWNEYPNDARFVFSFCFDCHRIHGHLDCT
jgi:hypothetical protein